MKAVLKRLIVAAGVAGALTISLVLNRPAFSLVVGAVSVFAALELRRRLHESTVLSTALTAVAVGGLAIAGHRGDPSLLVWIIAGFASTLLAGRVLSHELGFSEISGTTADVASSLIVTGLTGLMSAHLLLTRSLPRHGFEGVTFFGLVVAVLGVCALLFKKYAFVAGLIVAAAAGIAGALLLGEPFSLVSGALLGALIGVVAPIGNLTTRSIKPKGSLDFLDGLFFAAPFFYWTFRTLVI